MSDSIPDSPNPPIGLLEAIGIELEYMIVAEADLNIQPLADRILRDSSGTITGSVETGCMAWSNELVAHVIELKTKEPARNLSEIERHATSDIAEILQKLKLLHCRLLPTGMHPWMNPAQETRLWEHDYSEVYRQFDRIFNCQGHGWSNLQSTHINLPFSNEDEFGRLHAAIRVLLPILPALAASSPLMERHVTGAMDTRLKVYRTNCAKVPSVSGDIIPEPVFTPLDYQKTILQRIYSDMASMDTEGILQDEWCNARGAIARFHRNTIEIRLLDIQECPKADIAIAAAIVSALSWLMMEQWSSLKDQKDISTEALKSILLDCMEEADQAQIGNPDYLRLFGFETSAPIDAANLWHSILEKSLFSNSFKSLSRLDGRGMLMNRLNNLLFGPNPNHSQRTIQINHWHDTLEAILRRGCLARAIVHSCGSSLDHIQETYRQLAHCLETNQLFTSRPSPR